MKTNIENTQAGSDCQNRLIVPLLSWPDRCGFWWLRHKWGMELSESFLHGYPEEAESEYAVRMHNGGDSSFDPNLPRDFEGCAPEFVWLGESFDILHNVNVDAPAPPKTL